MNKKTTLRLLLIMILSVSFLSLIQIRLVSAAMSVYDVSGDVWDYPLFGGEPNRVSFYLEPYHYVFYANDSYDLVYKVATDVSSWSSEKEVPHDGWVNANWKLWFHNATGKVYVIWESSVNEDINMLVGTVSGGTISFGSILTVYDDSADVGATVSYVGSVCRLSDGKIMVAYNRKTGGGLLDTYAKYSDDEGASWSGGDSGTLIAVHETWDNNVRAVLPFTSSYALIIYVHRQVYISDWWYVIHAKYWNGTVLGSEETPTAHTAPNANLYWLLSWDPVITSDGVTHIAGSNNDNDVNYWNRTAGLGGSWSFYEDVIATTDIDVDGTLIVDGTDVTAFYIDNNYMIQTNKSGGWVADSLGSISSDWFAGACANYDASQGAINLFWVDEPSAWRVQTGNVSIPTPPILYEVNVTASPEFNVGFTISGDYHTTSWSGDVTEGSRNFHALQDPITRDSGLNIYGFSRWLLTNVTDSYNFTNNPLTIDLQTDTNFTIFYENNYNITVTSTGYTTAGFTSAGYSYTAPQNLTRDSGINTFVATQFQVVISPSYKYQFDHWTVNGSGSYTNVNLNVVIGGDTNLTMVYNGYSTETPYIPTFTSDAINGTWFMRSDTHTIHDQLGYRLDFGNTQTATYDSRVDAASYNISYGVRVFVYDTFDNMYELSGGTPEAIVYRTSDGAGEQSATFSCPAVLSLIDAIQINVYQRFGAESWSLRRYFISNAELYYKLPEATWTFYYFTNRTTTSTTAYFFHGSQDNASRLIFPYYRANPWEVALVKLNDANWLGFMFTPWTYYLGDMFWSLVLLFCVVTAYSRFGSLKPIIALLWLFGGSGAVLSAMIPAVALGISWLMLAVAMGITLFKLIYR